MCIRLAAIVCVGLAVPGQSVHAADLQIPTGDVILTVTGDITVTNGDGMAEFDLQMLRDLGQAQFTTTTIWTDGDQSFTGVWLHTIVEALGADAGSIAATAINDYSVEIPLTDMIEGGALVAYHRNGKPMPVRDKGPLWVVYPYSDTPEFQSEVIYSRSIWQLDRMHVQAN